MSNNLATYFDAITLSYMAHKGQSRRDLDIPYWTHVALVSSIVAEWGGDAIQIFGALAHDVIEDTGVGRETIDAILGVEVGSLVQSLTASKDKTKSWESRKLEYIIPFVVRQVDPRAYLDKLADSYANMTSFTNTTIRTGVPAAKAKTINSYVALAHICMFHLRDLASPEDYRVVKYNVKRMFNRVIETNTCPDAELLSQVDFEEETMADAWAWYQRLEAVWKVNSPT